MAPRQPLQHRAAISAPIPSPHAEKISCTERGLPQTVTSMRTTLKIYTERSPRAPPFVIFNHYGLLNGFKTQHHHLNYNCIHRLKNTKEAARQQASTRSIGRTSKTSKQAPPTTPHQTLDPSPPCITPSYSLNPSAQQNSIHLPHPIPRRHNPRRPHRIHPSSALHPPLCPTTATRS